MLVVPLTAYFDASRTDQPKDAPLVMAVGGFISSEERWLWFEDRWAKMLADFGLKYFHMREFTTFGGAFSGWQKRESDRRELVRRATDIVGKTAFQSIAAAVLIDHWTFCNQGFALDDNGFYPYPLCGWACIDHVRVWCHNRRPAYPLSEVLFVFEKGDPNQDDLRKRAKVDFGIEIQTPKAIPDDPTHRPLGALQAADFSAWHIRNIVRRKHADELEKYRRDFELLFSQVPTYPHHVHFSMEIYPHRLPTDEAELMSIRNEHDSDDASLVRFCQERQIPLRKEIQLFRKKVEGD